MSDVLTNRIERMTRFVKRMNEVERDLSSPYVRPKDAATLILVDRAGRVPMVLLGKRHHGHKFMPGKFVFPGGRVDPADRHMPAARPLDPSTEAHLMKRLQRPSAEKARAFALAAIRETFEETGLLLGVRGHATAKVPRGPWTAFAEANILPDLGALHFIGRAITPPGRPRRFDARFFTMDASAIAHRIDGVIGPEAELVELVWMPLADAKALDMPAVTGVMLEELDARIADGFAHDLPVPFYSMPRALTLARRRLGCARINAIEARHGEGHHHQSEAGFQRRHRFLLRDAQELAHHDRQAGEEEIRSGRQEARRIPRVQDQVRARGSERAAHACPILRNLAVN